MLWDARNTTFAWKPVVRRRGHNRERVGGRLSPVFLGTSNRVLDDFCVLSESMNALMRDAKDGTLDVNFDEAMCAYSLP